MANRDRVTIGVITNPNSKKNRARSGRAAELQAIVGDRGLVRETRTVGEIRPTVREFLERDVKYWVSDGGDGALHWLLNEARETLPAGADFPLTVPTNGGTIDFIAKKVGIRGEADEVLERLVRAEEEGRGLAIEEVPSFLMSGVRVEGGTERPLGGDRLVSPLHAPLIEKIGFCGAIAGIGSRFFDLYYRDPAPGPRTVVKVIAKGVASMALNAPLVRALPGVPASWRAYVHRLITPERARVRLDGEELPGREWRGIHVGSVFVDIGGVVRLFPLAGNGKLHVMVGNPTTPEILHCIPRLVRGKLMTRGFVDRACESIEVEAAPGETLKPCIDGEVFDGVARLKIVPGPVVRIPRPE